MAPAARWAERLYARDPAHFRQVAALASIATVATLLGGMSMQLGSPVTDPTPMHGAALGSVGDAGLHALWADSGTIEAVPPVAEEPVLTPVEPPGPFAQTLTATAVTDQAVHDTALFRRPGSQVSQLYHTGDVVDGYRIEQIQARAVTLVDGFGGRWIARMSMYPDDEAASGLQAEQPGGLPAAITRPNVAVERPDLLADVPDDTPEGATSIRRRLFRRMVVHGLLPSEQMAPREEPDGSVSGFVLGVNTGSVADRLGLEDGDVLVGVAGLAASEMTDPNDVFAEVGGDGHVCLDIERDGVITDMCYRRR